MIGCRTAADIERIRIAGPPETEGLWEPNGFLEGYRRVLEKYVAKTRNNEIHYARLSADKEARALLDGFLRGAGRRAVADAFFEASGHSQNEQTFYLNVYNACVLRGVLEFYPFKKLSELTGDFHRECLFFVRGEWLSLSQIGRRCGVEGDWRVAFALGGPSRSDPAIAPVLYTAEHLQGQLDEAVKNYIGSCAGLRIDHARRRVLLGKLLYERKVFFTSYYEGRYNIKGVSVISALAYWAWPRTQALLADLVGYKVRPMKRDDRLRDAAVEQEGGTAMDSLPCGIK